MQDTVYQMGGWIEVRSDILKIGTMDPQKALFIAPIFSVCELEILEKGIFTSKIRVSDINGNTIFEGKSGCDVAKLQKCINDINIACSELSKNAREQASEKTLNDNAANVSIFNSFEDHEIDTDWGKMPDKVYEGGGYIKIEKQFLIFKTINTLTPLFKTSIYGIKSIDLIDKSFLKKKIRVKSVNSQIIFEGDTSCSIESLQNCVSDIQLALSIYSDEVRLRMAFEHQKGLNNLKISAYQQFDGTSVAMEVETLKREENTKIILNGINKLSIDFLKTTSKEKISQIKELTKDFSNKVVEQDNIRKNLIIDLSMESDSNKKALIHESFYSYANFRLAYFNDKWVEADELFLNLVLQLHEEYNSQHLSDKVKEYTKVYNSLVEVMEKARVQIAPYADSVELKNLYTNLLSSYVRLFIGDGETGGVIPLDSENYFKDISKKKHLERSLKLITELHSRYSELKENIKFALNFNEKSLSIIVLIVNETSDFSKDLKKYLTVEESFPELLDQLKLFIVKSVYNEIFDANKNAILDVSEIDPFGDLIKSNQDIIGNHGIDYIQKFVRLNIFLKSKVKICSDAYRRLQLSQDMHSLQENIKFYNTIFAEYEKLSNHSLSMVSLLISGNLVDFFSTYELFDGMGVFDGSWENRVNKSLAEIKNELGDLNKNVTDFKNQVIDEIRSSSEINQTNIINLAVALNGKLNEISNMQIDGTRDVVTAITNPRLASNNLILDQIGLGALKPMNTSYQLGYQLSRFL